MIDVIAFFDNLDRMLEESPSADRLREIRDILDDPSYVLELTRFVSGINDPDVLSTLLSKMRRLRRRLEERCEKRKLYKEVVVQMGVVGGVGLIGGSIVAAASAAFPPAVLIAVAGGGWMSIQGFFAAARLDEERHLYEQLSALMTLILGKVQ